MGNTGTGKTHCAKAVWNYMCHRSDWEKHSFIPTVIYWPRFVLNLRSGDAYEKLAEMMRWPVVFLDDIGAERDKSGFASEQLNTLLGSRDDKWTILTSNLSLKNLGEIDPRIADRVIRKPNLFVEVKTKSHSLRTLK